MAMLCRHNACFCRHFGSVNTILETEKLIQDGGANTFDFVFIDADKANYQNYYEQSLELVRKGGLIAIDNVLWGGKVIDAKEQSNSTNAIRAFNKKLSNDERVNICMLPIADGLTLAMKR